MKEEEMYSSGMSAGFMSRRKPTMLSPFRGGGGCCHLWL